MAGQAHAISIDEDDLLPPWSTVFEIAQATDVQDWVLVGGLMVQLHAYRAGIEPPRATKDVDMIVDVAANRSNVSGVSHALERIGFEPDVPIKRSDPIYRFRREEEQVDLMVADHLPSRIQPRFKMRPAFPATAGEQSLRRRDLFVVTSATRTVTLGAPDVLGALIGKGAASVVDSRDPGRHLDDSVVLLASIDSVGALELAKLSSNDRKRLRAIAEPLADLTNSAWLTLGESQRAIARRNLSLVISTASL